MLSDGEHIITAGGVAHWVRVAGAANGGVPLVLLHGGPGGNAYSIERSVGERLAEILTVVFYDQRGCGRSERPTDSGTYSVGRLVADLEDLRSSLGIDRIVPWGVSFGCQVAAEYAVAHPDRVDRLVLHAPPIWGPLHPGVWTLRPASIDAVIGSSDRSKLRAALSELSDPLQRLFAATELLANDDAAARFLYHDPTVTPEREALWAATPAMNMDLARAMVGTERTGLADDLAALALPTLVMIGLWDRHVGVDIARDLADRLPHGLLRLFERSAHLIDEEEPGRYVAAITDFLRAGKA
jgi:proline iminopeptidase